MWGAMKDGFTVLRHEDQTGFDGLLASYREEFHPETPHECFLIELMAQARWRIARLQRIESATLDSLVSPAADPKNSPEELIARKFGNGAGSTLAMLQRMISASERSYFKARAELMQYRQMRNEARTVEALDAGVLKRIVSAPPPRVQNEPKLPGTLVMSAAVNPALRL